MNETGKIFDEITEILNKKNEEIEALNKELIKTRSEVNETNIRNNLLESKNNSLLKENLEYLEENRRTIEDCGKLHDILCKNCKYDNDVDDICFRVCKCGSHFCPEDSKELHKKIECLEVEGSHLAEEYLELKGKYEKLLEEKDKEIQSLNISKEFYINKAKELAAERDDFSKKWDKSLCEIGELKKQNVSAFYDILDSDRLTIAHYQTNTGYNRYTIMRSLSEDEEAAIHDDDIIVGYLYVKKKDEDQSLCYRSIAEVKSWCIGEGEVYEDDVKYVKIPRHQIAIIPMRKDGIEAAEKWVIE